MNLSLQHITLFIRQHIVGWNNGDMEMELAKKTFFFFKYFLNITQEFIKLYYSGRIKKKKRNYLHSCKMEVLKKIILN